MAKKLSKILWHDTKVDGAGKPVLPSVATDDKGLNGLLPGELFMHVGKEKVSLWALSLSGEVVEVSGKTDEVDIDFSDYLLKSVWDSVFEIKTDVSGQKYIFGKLPVVTKYGITMYADDGNVEIPQLAEGLPYDQRTIWFNPETKQIEVIGGTGGGGEGGVSNFWDLSGIPSWITNSKPIYNYSEIKNTPDLSVFVTGTALSETLADYATLTYLTGELKKYVTLDGAQDIKGVKNFVNGLKIGGLPITKKQDDVVYLDANLVVRGGITMYAENEVDIPSILDSLPIASNTALGIASFDSTYFSVDSNGMVSLTSAPSSGASSLGQLLNVDASIDATASVDRVLYQPAGSAMWTWRELPKDGVVGDYLPLSGGTLTGSLTVNGSFSSVSAQVGQIFLGETNEINGAGGSLFLNYRGNARLLLGNNGYPVIVGTYANQAANIQNTLNYAPFSVFGTIFGYRYGKKASGAAFMFDKPGANYTGIGADGTTDTIYFGACNKDGDWVYHNQIWKFGGSIVCGALKIWDTNVIDGVGGSTVHLNYYEKSDVAFCKGGGTTIAYGNLLTHGGITMYSDQRKKTILNHVELSLKQIADAPLIEHYYNSDQDKTTHVGSIAQYWAGLNDWFCKLDNEGFYTMEIQNCALASAISIARHLEKYESKTDKTIRKMKQRIQELEEEVERLKQN